MPIGLRAVLAAAAALAAGAFSAVILGEYEFTGWTPWLAGAVVGFLVAEINLAVAHRRLVALAVVTGAAGAGAILWAGWISSGRGVAPYPDLAWWGAALAGVVAVWRTWPRPTSSESEAPPRT